MRYTALYAAPLPEFTLHASRKLFKTEREAFMTSLAKTPDLVQKVNQLLLELELVTLSTRSSATIWT